MLARHWQRPYEPHMSNFTRRRVLIGGIAAFAANLVRPIPAQAFAGTRSLAFENLHTGEKLDVEYWTRDGYVPDALGAVNRILRDFRTGDVHPIEPALLDLLNSLRLNLDTASPIQIISGYRSPATNAKLHEGSAGVATNSLHMRGMAIDIRIAGRALPTVRAAAFALRAGGVGYYPRSDFVHVDIGRVRTW
jgi:uncharacterized protein YcbK (DUF882 family)